MSNKIFSIMFLTFVVIAGLIYRDKLENIWIGSFSYYFPCKLTIKYSIGTFDTKFGISQKDFLDALAQAEKIWETPIKKDLFQYDPEGSLKINLIYDTRQESTVQLQKMGIVVKNNKASYDELKAKYDSLSRDYQNQKSYFQTKLADFEKRKSAYEAEVSSINSRGGANKSTYSRLNAEKEYLNSQVTIIQQLQDNLNFSADNLNVLANSLNTLAKSLNMVVDKYNTIGDNLGGEFDEGLYRSSSDGKEIDIFQYDNKTKLIRVLAHELGHALGLDHNEDPKAIMYRQNNGINEKATNTDIKDLKNLCGVK